jgi:RHS repeat-associated protein
VTEAEGSSPDIAAETRTTYDGLDRVTVTEVGYGSASSQRTEVTLDLGGRAIETDDGFTCASVTFDHRDLVQVKTDSLDTSTCASNADSRETTNTHDAVGRLLATEVTDGPDNGDITSVVTLDAVGNTLTSGDTTATVTHETTFEVNQLGQVMTEGRDDDSTAKTTYDPVGNPTDQCTWSADLVADVGDCLPVGSTPWTDPPTSSTSTRWDARNGRIGLTDAASNQTTVYDPDENYAVSAVYLPTDADQTKEHQSLYEYDSRHRLTDITHQLCTITTGHACPSPTATGSVAYGYDDNDNRTTVNEDNGATSADYRYCYDARNQLTARRTGAACTSSPTETNAYDEAGNRTQAVTAGPVTRNFAYTGAGVLCDVETGSAASCSGGNVTSDDAGRISGYASWTYLYDAEARLVSACEDADCVGSGFDRVDFTYDGEGHRTGITETPAVGSPVETVFRYQGDAVVGVEVDGTPHHEYVTDPAGTIVKVIVLDGADAGTYMPVWNGHGDAMALYRVDGADLTLANSYTYSTWGQPTTATHNGVADLGFRFLYVGAGGVQWDGTYGLGLTYMRARHYSPELGRFLQPDSSRVDQNLFVYTGNGPVSRVDPSGDTWAEVLYCSNHWFECYYGAVLADLATAAAKHLYGAYRDGSRGNAFKHCVWAGACAILLGPLTAKIITDAHENIYYGWRFGQDNLRNERMDLRNNRAGIALGATIGRRLGPIGVLLSSNRTIVNKMKSPCLKAIAAGEHRRAGGLTWYK